MNKIIKGACYTLFAVMLASCAGRSPDSTFYSLVSEAVPAVKCAKKFNDLDVVIKGVDLPSYLDRPQIIVKENGGTKVRISEFNRWAGNLSENIKSVMAEDISAALNNARVKPLTFGDRGYKYAVSAEFYRFDASDDGKVTLIAWWKIDCGNEQNKNIGGRFEMSKEYDGSYDDMVKKQSELLAEMSEKIAKKIASL